MTGMQIILYLTEMGLCLLYGNMIGRRFERKRKFPLLETAEILADNDFMEAIREGIKQADRGETRPWADVKHDLGLGAD